ncbi:MAG: endonuclease/exonuclease/phosphatase family protein [bacterium]|nr:endonuclease/exonuclease/phosphatase family protein [bacterium]
MPTFRPIALALITTLAMGASRPAILPAAPLSATPPPFTGDLSVLTYNVHGAPWPVTWDRPAQFDRMAATLAHLRRMGHNPHIVVLQEAFTQDAQAIGRAAGYRYIVDGPTAATGSTARADGADQLFAAANSWFKGEGLGKYVGSGLQILSDYPLTDVHRMAYPSFACAGYDCLANKGAVMASVQLPDRTDPVDIVTTHLNSRFASGVADGRSLQAYRQQVGYLTDFIHSAHNPAHALIVAGDFNVGWSTARRTDLLDHAHRDWSAPGDGIDNAYDAARRTAMPLSKDAIFSRNRARDWEFYAPGKVTTIALRQIDVPFGHAADGSMLSDHVGYTATFHLSRPGRTATSFARSTRSGSGAARA